MTPTFQLGVCSPSLLLNCIWSPKTTQRECKIACILQSHTPVCDILSSQGSSGGYLRYLRIKAPYGKLCPQISLLRFQLATESVNFQGPDDDCSMRSGSSSCSSGPCAGCQTDVLTVAMENWVSKLL